MRHAQGDALDQLEPLLVQLRAVVGLREKNRGTFYRGSKACIHFHEDPAGLFADVKVGDRFERFPVNTAAERKRVLGVVRG